MSNLRYNQHLKGCQEVQLYVIWNVIQKTRCVVYLNINQLDALNFIMSLFHASTCFKHHVLIVRRSKLYYTASGIITPIGGRPVHRLREDSVKIQYQVTSS
jgi:hypothetical protein